MLTDLPIIKVLYDIFWHHWFWLPKGTDWNDLQKYNDYAYARTVMYVLCTALLIYLIRRACERFIAMPIARCLNIPEHSACEFKQHPELEAYFRDKGSHPSDSIFLFISKETKMEFSHVKKWFESRKLSRKPSKANKFTESFWRFTFYLVMWFTGIVILWDKPWFYDTSKCWNDYQKYPILTDVYVYYIIEAAFYVSLSVSQFFDVRRKDFWQMFIHHCCTLSLMAFSYLSNTTRAGSLVLLLHDTVDYWLELAKLCVYAKKKKLSNVFFVIFTFVWFITRLVIFPTKILYTTAVEAPRVVGLFPGFYIFNGFMFSLQILHIIWFITIVKLIYKSLESGGIDKDNRSESDDDSDHERKAE